MARRPLRLVLLGIGFAAIACSPEPPERRATTRGAAELETRYERLDPRQQQLVSEWTQRYNEAFQTSLAAQQAYNELPLSTKTTFEAVTDALLGTRLTGEGDSPLARGDQPLRDALDLVEKLDAIKGKRKGAGGDEQFRIYVQLASDSVRLLGESREFSRGSDNFVYHKGYPMSFRLETGVPSIQFSISEDGGFADIDVDYRSSKFPQALFNGHLTSANSDVRAGANYDAHRALWRGLDEWWHGWEGLGDWWSALHGVRDAPPPPGEPRKGRGKIDEAAFDFLAAWLVEHDLDAAVSYFSESAYACLARDRAQTGDGDASPEVVLRENMRIANEVVGTPTSLDAVIEGVAVPELRLRTVTDNAHGDRFVLSEVPALRMVDFHCAFRGRSLNRAQRELLGRRRDFTLSTFFLKSGEMRGATIALLWSRESDVWRIASYELEAAVGLVPDLRARARSLELSPDAVPGDPDFVRRSRAFVEAWFLRNEYGKALEFFSKRAYPCVGLFGDGSSGEEPASRLLGGLRAVGEFVGKIEGERLEDAIAAVEPASGELQPLEESTDAYTLFGIPDALAESLDCSIPLEERAPVAALVRSASDRYAATAFRLKVVGEEPAAFFLVWTKESDAWRVVSFDLMAS